MKQHKWHKEIKAWADGAEIESYAGKCDDIWDDAPNPNWNNSNLEYRIKPQPVEPQYLYVYKHEGNGISFGYKPHAGTNMWQTKIIGKIPLIVESNDD